MSDLKNFCSRDRVQTSGRWRNLPRLLPELVLRPCGRPVQGVRVWRLWGQREQLLDGGKVRKRLQWWVSPVNPAGRALAHFVMVFYENFFQSALRIFCSFRARLKNFLTGSHYKIICGQFRNECSSYRKVNRNIDYAVQIKSMPSFNIFPKSHPMAENRLFPKLCNLI